MTSEFAYEFRAKGHVPQQRRAYRQPHSSLARDFMDYANMEFTQLRDSYENALEALGGRKYSSEEAHAFLVSHDVLDATTNYLVGMFLSAIYNTNDEQEIIYDFDGLPPDIWGLAYRLPKHKVFVNKGVAFSAGNGASGIIINYENYSDEFGHEHPGPIVNYGNSSFLGYNASDLVVNCGKVSVDMGARASGVLLNFDEGVGHMAGRIATVNRSAADPKIELGKEEASQIPGMAEYLGSLRDRFESGRNDYRQVVALLNELGPQPGRRIGQDIRRIAGSV